jgi:DNA-binding GntR family transcriptional regulator
MTSGDSASPGIIGTGAAPGTGATPGTGAPRGMGVATGSEDERRDPRRYRRIADEVRALITSGAIVSADPAPTIAELAGEHGCARQTAAKALRVLVDEGLLIRYPGFGYYVAPLRPSVQE